MMSETLYPKDHVADSHENGYGTKILFCVFINYLIDDDLEK